MSIRNKYGGWATGHFLVIRAAAVGGRFSEARGYAEPLFGIFSFNLFHPQQSSVRSYYERCKRKEKEINVSIAF